MKKATLITPKARIHQKFGSKACYTIQEVEVFPQKSCPGLSVPQNSASQFRCLLQLPDFSVVSDPFTKKKDAQQSAALLALNKLGINSETSIPTVSDAENEMGSRLSYMFSDEFLSSLHPLSAHLKAVLRREGELSGLLPLSAVISCDTKLGNLCKSIDARVESNPFLSIPIIKGAAARLSDLVVLSEEDLWIKRKKPYPSDLMIAIVNEQTDMITQATLEAVYIPYSLDKSMVSVTLNLHSDGYYLDIIAGVLGLADASKLLISRTIGKASSETRLYFSASEENILNPVQEFHNAKELSTFDCSFNILASYLLGQNVYGNAILASVGYTWRGAELFAEDVSVRSCFRMLLSKTPDGLFKLSRDAVLIADLPVLYTTKKNWRGSSPRDILCALCRQHRLSEPAITVVCNSLKEGESPELCNKLTAKFTNGGVISGKGGSLATDGQSLDTIETFRCAIKVFAKNQNLILECSPLESFKKQGDAVQNASLRVLLWLNMYFRQPNIPLEELSSSSSKHNIQCDLACFLKEFFLCRLIHDVQPADLVEGTKINPNHMTPQNNPTILENNDLNMEGTVSGSAPSNGSLVCISYTAHLISKGTEIREILERNDEFEFEIGTGAVIPYIEAAIVQMTPGQSVSFYADMPPKELVLAAATHTEKVLSLLSSKPCCLEYNICVLRVTEPLEDRMEQALFSPPLSKQRVEFAMQCIKDLSATSLIDFGCGSGSLLDALADTPSSLEKIIGVDLSQKGLIRAAKVLNSKLEKMGAMMPSSRIKSAILYRGSITDFDSRLYSFDIGTCLEVIEHMEEEQACLFGDVALGLFCPRVLIVSTPNYEYNVILQKSNLAMEEDGQDEKTQQSCKFRNDDHKFEWTREQFNRWATGLALKYNYTVEFGGVGGVHGVEPGFASQIAVFKRDENRPVRGSGLNIKAGHHHFETLWEWNTATTVS